MLLINYSHKKIHISLFSFILTELLIDPQIKIFKKEIFTKLCLFFWRAFILTNQISQKLVWSSYKCDKKEEIKAHTNNDIIRGLIKCRRCDKLFPCRWTWGWSQASEKQHRQSPPKACSQCARTSVCTPKCSARKSPPCSDLAKTRLPFHRECKGKRCKFNHPCWNHWWRNARCKCTCHVRAGIPSQACFPHRTFSRLDRSW